MSAEAEKLLTISYKWKCPVKDLIGIDNPLDQSQLQNAESPVFLVAHNGVFHKFQLLALAEPSQKTKDHMGMYLRVCKNGLSDKIKYKVIEAAYSTGMDSEAKPISNHSSKFAFAAVKYGRGCAKAIKLVENDGNYMLPFEDCKTVTFHYTISFPESEFDVGSYVSQELEDSEDTVLNELYDSTLTEPRQPTVDLTLVCDDGTKVHAHKCILVTLSDVFKNLFKSDMKKDAQSDQIKVEGLESEAVKELVRFAYLKAASEDVDDDDENAGLVTDVLKAAHMYLVKPLIDECERIMVERIVNDELEYDAIDYYCFAKLYGLKVLANVCTVVLLENWLELGVSADERLQDHIVPLTEKLVKYSRCHIISFK